MGSPRSFPTVLFDGLEMESLPREHSFMAWGIAGWGQELELTMAATKEESHSGRGERASWGDEGESSQLERNVGATLGSAECSRRMYRP